MLMLCHTLHCATSLLKRYDMQIRNRNGHLEFLRASWDKEKKRTVQKLIKVNEFTEDEKVQHAEFMIKEKFKEDRIISTDIAMKMTHALRKMIAGLAYGARPTEPLLVYDLITQLQKSLKKAGVVKPPKPVPEVTKKNV